MVRFFDTSSVLEGYNILTENDIISSVTLEELENIKTSTNKDNDVKYKARQAVKAIKDKNVKVYLFTEDSGKFLNNDDKILFSAKSYKYNKSIPLEDMIIYTEDYLFELFAKYKYDFINVASVKNITKEEKYTGYIVINGDDSRLEDFYTNPTNNIFNCLINQYVMIKNDDGIISDFWRWNGNKYIKATYKSNKNDFEKLKSRNAEQTLALNLLSDNDIGVKLITGFYGSGKTYLCANAAMNMIKNNQFEKLVFVRNPQPVKDSEELGYLKGELLDKMMPWIALLGDAIGGQFSLREALDRGIIEVIPLSMLRGRDFKNSIIYATECQSFNASHMKLLLGRVAEGSILICEGDAKQTDKVAFEGDNNGIQRLIDALKGNPHFGYVNLSKCERSSIAELAELL